MLFKIGFRNLNNKGLLLPVWSKNVANIVGLKDWFNLDTNVGAQNLHLLLDRVC